MSKKHWCTAVLSPVHTGDYSRRFRRKFVAENGDCRRFWRQSPNSPVWTGFQSAALDQAPNLFSSYNEVDVYGKITYAYRTYVIRNNNVRVSYLRSHLDQCINFKLATLTHNTLSSSQPAYITSALFLATTSRNVLYALPTPICCRSLGSTQLTFASRGFSIAVPSVWNSLPGIHACSSSHTFRHTVSSRPSISPSSSHKCLRFGLWLTLRTIKWFYLLTYLFTYLKGKAGTHNQEL